MNTLRNRRLPIKQRVLLLLKEHGPMTIEEIAHALQVSDQCARSGLKQHRDDEARGEPREIYVSYMSTHPIRGGGLRRTWAAGDLPDTDVVHVEARTIEQRIDPTEMLWVVQHREEARQENDQCLSAHMRAIASSPDNPFAGLIWQATR